MKKLKLSKSNQSGKLTRDKQQTLLSVRRIIESSSDRPQSQKRQLIEIVATPKEEDEDDDDFKSCSKKPRFTRNRSRSAITSEADILVIDDSASDKSPSSEVTYKLSAKEEVSNSGEDLKSTVSNETMPEKSKKCSLCDERINCGEYDRHFRYCLRSRYERRPSIEDASTSLGSQNFHFVVLR